jgi:iron complex outermembrane receptor protein
MFPGEETMRIYSALLIASLAVPMHNALAQEQIAPAEVDEDRLEEIVVTGSAIKRVDLDSSLPIQVITADQFDREGITNASDLIENIPAMQGFTTESDSVGGSGGGIRTANLRAIGSQYTLSLLDGRRMAPADSGSSIDLSNIPLAAVEQVQILTDGAGALYGSDAIAGVVNFMLKDSVDETTVNLRSDRPALRTRQFSSISKSAARTPPTPSFHRPSRSTSTSRSRARRPSTAISLRSCTRM